MFRARCQSHFGVVIKNSSVFGRRFVEPLAQSGESGTVYKPCLAWFCQGG